MKFYINYELKNRIALVIACHTSDCKKIKLMKNNLKYFENVVSDIYIIDSSEFRGLLEKELDEFKYIFNLNFLYIKNSPLLCHIKWYECLKLIVDKYDKFILTNDSFFLINPLSNFFQFTKDNEKEMIGLIDSYEQKYHYPDFLRIYNRVGIKKWMKYFEFQVNEENCCSSYNELVQKMEINSMKITNSKDCLYKMNSNFKGNLHYNDNINEEFITKLKYPIVKLKKINHNIPKYLIDHLSQII